AVTTRDQTCCFPHCDRPARWADLDHIHPYNHNPTDTPPDTPPDTPGQTRAHNLQPLCRAHHLAKTHHGWTPTRNPTTGTTTWTAPTGHTYTRPATRTDLTISVRPAVSDGPAVSDRPALGDGPAVSDRPAVSDGPTISSDVTSLADDLRRRLGTRERPTSGNHDQTGGPALQRNRVLPEEPPF
ncbi:HNH endonuclease signature motif containing protein, partial [Promicromonospora sp. NPDC052451]|uniref:HNH endonuclease signature motif containing protein n=1 Tax=Promicromonospora sp. NPDC052451 TaxID=3364407 RepID=UPI0037CAA208